MLLLLLAGVAVGLLIAPDKGSETWNKVVDGLDDVKDKAMDEMNNLVAKGKELVSKGMETAQKSSKFWN